jgi:sec-independent protein translocase protein TatA
MLGVQELLIILVIVVLVFGAKRIPEIMGGLGKGIRTFKKAIDGEETPDSIAPSPPPTPAPPQTPPKTGNEEGTVSKEKIEPK